MAKAGTLALLLALALFLIFFGNVLSGATGSGEFFGDVIQVLLLVAACTSFVVGILMKEAQARSDKP